MSNKKKGWAGAFTSLFVEIEDTGASSSTADAPVDIDALLRETSALTADTPVPAASAPPSSTSTKAAAAPPPGLEIGQPLADLYTAYGVPPSPKPVEQIILFLEGLKGMPESVQTQALTAMDEADPNWSIADVMLDARYKIDALGKARGAVDGQVADARARSEGQIAAQVEYLNDAEQTIHGQIASLQEQIRELEALLETERQQVEERKASASDRIRALEVQASDEHSRIQTETARITAIVNAFGPLAEEA